MNTEPHGPRNGLLAGKRCMVLEDEFLIVLDIEEILGTLGAADITRTNTLAAALSALNGATAFDFAVLDYKLGEDTSVPVARMLSARKIPYVFITGLIQAARPGDEFAHIPTVVKPYDQASLLAAFTAALKSN